ncbi:MAG: T9SS type A sorting domain-containing protein [Flavipsychrobacter sp.]|nr:T9SS type A sorting domain-containing protein [Flavipsychrobacter sp.]
MKRILTLISLLMFCTAWCRAQIIVPIAGSGGTVDADGPATAVSLDYPLRIAFDDTGSLYICDCYHHKLRKVKPSYQGYMTTIAGNGVSGDWGDGGPASAAGLGALYDVAVDKKGNIFLADAFYNKIRKIDKNGIITTFAGTGVAGFNGDGIAATSAFLNEPFAVRVDDTGNVYIGDRSNYRLRKVDTFGVITTIAGTGVAGFSGDGGSATLAQTNGLISIALDTAYNIYFSDSTRVRKIATDGTITTVAGNGIVAFTGDGGPATAAAIRPAAIFVDKTGILYIADGTNDRIRKVGVDGVINTIAGTGMAGNSGDWGPPLLATLCAPYGIAVNNDGDIYFSNLCSARVKMITNKDLASVRSEAKVLPAMVVAPNPGHGKIRVTLTGQWHGIVKITATNDAGKVITQFQGRSSTINESPDQLPPGVYVITATDNSEHTVSEKVIVQ